MRDLCRDDDLVFEKAGCIAESLLDILRRQMGIGLEDVRPAGPLRDQFQQELDADPRSLDTGFAAEDLGIGRDALEHGDGSPPAILPQSHPAQGFRPDCLLGAPASCRPSNQKRSKKPAGCRRSQQTTFTPSPAPPERSPAPPPASLPA